MITRRFLLAIGPSAFFGVPASAFAPANSWNNKKPEAWSEKEIGLILNRSPWAKEVRSKWIFLTVTGWKVALSALDLRVAEVRAA
jgi:hypothetical protein